MIIEPLGPPPGEEANQDECDAFSTRQEYYIIAQNTIFNMIYPHMRGYWETIDLDEIIQDLKEIFEPLVSLMKHDCLDKFLSCKMIEHISVGMHLAKMNRIHRCLTVELEYEMIDAFTKSMVLCSLPPSYRDFVESFVKRNEAVNFHQLLGRIRTHNMEPAQAQISI
jgi:hypothetical protein